MNRLWARAVVELQWHDEKGQHYEQGDGNLILVLPKSAALSIGKLGNQIMWAGCDDDRYWLFDLRDERALYVGHHDGRGARGGGHWPLPIRPQQLTQLLGLVPVEPPGPDMAPVQVTSRDGGFLFEPPSGGRRIWVDPLTARPRRIELLDADGHSQVTCRLSRWEPMMVEGLPPGGLPWVATRLEVTLVNQGGTMTLFLSDVSDGQAQNRIKDKVFNLQQLIRVFKPSQVVDLDQIDATKPDRPVSGPVPVTRRRADSREARAG